MADLEYDSLLNPRQSAASPIPSDYHSVLSTSDNSFGTTVANDLAADFGRDIEPYEAVACQLLTDEIRAFVPYGSNAPPVRPAGRNADSLETVLRQAAHTIRFNAKWFAPGPLAILLESAFDAARTSSASLDLFAAVLLIVTVATYSSLPTSCLLPIARFITYAYHQGSRANRLRKLSVNAWTAASHILQSHLGGQFLSALLDIIRSDMDVFDSRAGFAHIAGALGIVSDKLMQRQNELPTIQLVIGLRSAAVGPENLIREKIMELVKDTLANDQKVHDLDLDAGWDILLEVVEHCVGSGPILNNTLRSLITAVEHFASHLEPRQLHIMAYLLIAAARPLPPIVQTEMAHAYRRMPPRILTPELKNTLGQLCRSDLYHVELRLVVKQSLETLTVVSNPDAARDFVEEYTRLICSSHATPSSKAIIGGEIVDTFDAVMMDLDAEPQCRRIAFDAICCMADCMPVAASTLFRLRTDIVGHLYFQRECALERPVLRHTAATAILQDARYLPIEVWFTVFQRVIIDAAKDWHTYDIYLTQTMSLLGNHASFTNRLDVIRKIRASVCHRIERSQFVDPPAYTGFSKYYVMAQHIKILTVLISYHPHFSKRDVLGLISIFTNTAGSGDYTVSKHCIHALTICCYELPVLMSSYMDDVIDKMSKMVTQKYLAIHVLQFLGGLSRLPDLYRNFTQTDYKKILGVCQSYLQSTRGVNSVPSRRQTPTSDHSSNANSEEALPDYVYALAHHVMTFWYMAMKQHDRQGLKPYITNCLTYTGMDGRKVVEDQALVTIDMMDRLDAEDNFTGDGPGRLSHHEGRVVTRNRLVGLLLVTTETALRTGKTLVTIRRASGTVYRLLEPAINSEAEITVIDRSEQDYLTMVEDDTLGRTYGKIAIPRPSSALGALDIVTLPDDDGARRAIATLDRTPALESYKAGLIYIGEGQSTEAEILGNVSGSPDYRDLLADIGSAEALRGAKFNTHGLDRANDTDGQHAIVWKNEWTELVFHVTTLMPGCADDERESLAMKKRHIGNDYVNIIFNNSGGALSFTELYNLFPSAFSLVYIVITPSARTSFIEARTVNLLRPKEARFYKVQVLSRPDYPAVSPATEEKVVSGASLPGFVRDLAVHDCIISLMSSPGVSREYPSSWRARLEQLRRIGDRYRTKWT